MSAPGLKLREDAEMAVQSCGEGRFAPPCCQRTELKGRRILILFPHLTCPGGALIYTMKLAGFLAERGATVGIVTLCADTVKFPAPTGVEVFALNGPVTSSLKYWAFLPWWQLRINEAIDAWQPDLLIPQVFPANWWGWLYRLTRRTPLLWICHEPSAFIHSRPWINALVPCWKRWLARLLRPLLSAADIRLSRQSDGIVANSGYTRGMVRAIYGSETVAVAHPGLDGSVFRPETGAPRSGIMTVARLTKFKRVDFLMKVFAAVSENHPDMVFNIVGRGEEEAALRLLAQELGIGRRVIFHGSVSNEALARLYQRSLLLLHGSVEEPFGMAPLEAIACGTPVVAHRSGGPLEVVDNSCGRLVDSLSIERWVEAVEELFSAMEDRDSGYADRVADRAAGFVWEETLAPMLPIIRDLAVRHD